MMTLSYNNCENIFEVSEETASIMLRRESESGELIVCGECADKIVAVSKGGPVDIEPCCLGIFIGACDCEEENQA